MRYKIWSRGSNLDKISLQDHFWAQNYSVDHWISFLGRDFSRDKQCHLSCNSRIWFVLPKAVLVNFLSKLTWKLWSFRPEFHGYAGSEGQTGFWKYWLCIFLITYLIGMADISLMAVVPPPIWSSNQYSPVLSPIAVRYFVKHKMPLGKCSSKYQHCKNALSTSNATTLLKLCLKSLYIPLLQCYQKHFSMNLQP